MKHTPGPWFSGGNVINDGTGVIAVTARNDSAFQYAADPGSLVDSANSRLIAAAPELLELARLILAEWEKPTEGIARGELVARLSQYSIEARAVIEKATGGDV